MYGFTPVPNSVTGLDVLGWAVLAGTFGLGWMLWDIGAIGAAMNKAGPGREEFCLSMRPLGCLLSMKGEHT